jgi:hypothetical protein
MPTPTAIRVDSGKDRTLLFSFGMYMSVPKRSNTDQSPREIGEKMAAMPPKDSNNVVRRVV